jgi:hypothetical protein
MSKKRGATGGSSRLPLTPHSLAQREPLRVVFEILAPIFIKEPPEMRKSQFNEETRELIVNSARSFQTFRDLENGYENKKETASFFYIIK